MTSTSTFSACDTLLAKCFLCIGGEVSLNLSPNSGRVYALSRLIKIRNIAKAWHETCTMNVVGSILQSIYVLRASTASDNGHTI